MYYYFNDRKCRNGGQIIPIRRLVHHVTKRHDDAYTPFLYITSTLIHTKAMIKEHLYI